MWEDQIDDVRSLWKKEYYTMYRIYCYVDRCGRSFLRIHSVPSMFKINVMIDAIDEWVQIKQFLLMYEVHARVEMQNMICFLDCTVYPWYLSV